MKVAVVGANGQVGSDICHALEASGHQVSPLTHAQIEICDEGSVATALPDALDAVVNTAAMHDVEQCEREPLRALAVNGVGVRNLARRCDQIGAYFLHVSTDYVFDGGKATPYVESDAPLPLNAYGTSKLAGEHFTLAGSDNSAVLRVSGVYGKNPCRAKSGMNFVRLMLKLGGERDEVKVVDNEVLTPTYAVDIANQVALLVGERVPGLLHGTAQGGCSWYEFAAEILRANGLLHKLKRAAPGDFPAKVPRPSYSVLENARLQQLGLDRMPEWQSGLKRYLHELAS